MSQFLYSEIKECVYSSQLNLNYNLYLVQQKIS